MSTLEVLVRARKLIASKHHWARGALARMKSGKKTDPDSRGAVRWCSVGAIERSGASENIWCQVWAIDMLTRAMGTAPDHFNDHHTHAEVLAAFDVAIEAERGK